MGAAASRRSSPATELSDEVPECPSASTSDSHGDWVIIGDLSGRRPTELSAMGAVACRSCSPDADLSDEAPDCTSASASESLGDWVVLDEVSDCTSESLGGWVVIEEDMLDPLPWPQPLSAIAPKREEMFETTKSNLLASRETAVVIKYIEDNANEDKTRLLACIDQVEVAAIQMKSLTVPTTQDGPERWLCSAVIDAYIATQRRQFADLYSVLLLNTSDQAWLESLSDVTNDLGYTSVEELEADMTVTAESFLGYKMVFFPMNLDRVHWYLLVLNFVAREYQILDSLDLSPPRNYECKLRNFRAGIERCFDIAGKKNSEAAAAATDIAGWKLHKIEDIPKQTDDSSCGLFVLRYMELWNGRDLIDGFTQKDVDSFRINLAGELLFSKLNEMQNVIEELYWIM